MGHGDAEDSLPTYESAFQLTVSATFPKSCFYVPPPSQLREQGFYGDSSPLE